jgi:hypothetical protein
LDGFRSIFVMAGLFAGDARLPSLRATGRVNVRPTYSVVIRGLEPAYPSLEKNLAKWMDCRVKPGNDGNSVRDQRSPRSPEPINTASRSRRLFRARFAGSFRPLPNRGRGECRAPDAPAASCALLVTSMHTSIHSEPSEITRHSRTQWFTAYTALSPVIGFLATVVMRIAPQT